MGRGLLFAVFFISNILVLRADITISATRVCLGNATTLTNTSNQPHTQVVEWDLDNDGFFDDGLGNQLAYNFSTADTFDVRIRITDSLGSEYFSQSFSVIVDPLPQVSFEIIDTCLGNTTGFINNTSISSATILTYAWDYDNNGSTDNTNTHGSFQYSTAGTYHVLLNVTSGQGCISSRLKAITIVSPPSSALSNAPAGCAKSNMVFYNSSVGNITQTIWNFGDSTLSFEPDSAVHAYNAPGSYTVSLTSIAITGCADTAFYMVIVDSALQSSYTLSNGSTFYEGGSTTATVTGNYTNIVWNDQSTENPKVINTPGTFSYKVTDNQGCTAENNFTIAVLPLPDVANAANDFLTPNGDGKNDVLLFPNLQAFSNCVLKVYDYRGLPVYSNNNYQNNWNAEGLNAGAYYYILECTGRPAVKGVTNLIR